MSADVIQLSRHGTIPMKNDRSRLQVTTTEASELTKHESINHDGYGSTLKLVRRNVWGRRGLSIVSRVISRAEILVLKYLLSGVSTSFDMVEEKFANFRI